MNQRSTLFDSVKGIAIFGIMFIHLGSWLLKPEEGSTFATLTTAGLLGVELTFIVNAYFLAKHFDKYRYEKLEGWLYITKSFLKIIPIYWLALIVYWLSLKISVGSCPLDYLNILSHFLFLNALNPQWWIDFMGGSGYFGIIALMWIIFPLYMKVAKNLRIALFFTVVVVFVTSYVEDFVIQINENFKLYKSHDVNVWIWYIKRGLDCYAIGIVLYYLSNLKLRIFETHRNIKQLLIYVVLSYIAYKCATKGGAFDGVRFSILSCVIIVLAFNEKITIIDNPILVFLGRNITELFVLHVILYYIFVDHNKILVPGVFAFFILFGLSLLLAPFLRNTISIPLGNFLCNRYSSFLSKIVYKK